MPLHRSELGLREHDTDDEINEEIENINRRRVERAMVEAGVKFKVRTCKLLTWAGGLLGWSHCDPLCGCTPDFIGTYRPLH